MPAGLVLQYEKPVQRCQAETDESHDNISNGTARPLQVMPQLEGAWMYEVGATGSVNGWNDHLNPVSWKQSVARIFFFNMTSELPQKTYQQSYPPQIAIN